MREIKFRVWDTIAKRFFYPNKDKGYISLIGTVCGTELNDDGSEFVRAEDYRSEANQYTGLRDKDGNDIYEGDIIGYEDKRCKNGIHVDYVVEWEEHTSNDVYEDRSFSGYPFVNGEITNHIVGNIYENPELLKK